MKVFHEWTDEDGQEYRVIDTPCGPLAQSLYEEADDFWLTAGDESTGAEILRLRGLLEEAARAIDKYETPGRRSAGLAVVLSNESVTRIRQALHREGEV